MEAVPKTVSLMWAMTLLSLYVRVQVTILGSHLYLDFAQGTNESDTFNENGHNTFVAMDDYLVTDKITAFIVQMQNAATEDMFMALSKDNSWINYLVLENPPIYAQLKVVSNTGFDDSSLLNNFRKLYQLMCGGPRQGVAFLFILYMFFFLCLDNLFLFAWTFLFILDIFSTCKLSLLLGIHHFLLLGGVDKKVLFSIFLLFIQGANIFTLLNYIHDDCLKLIWWSYLHMNRKHIYNLILVPVVWFNRNFHLCLCDGLHFAHMVMILTF
ncbi:hypothetical protein ACJX0J_023772, partial [Zea mays]